MSETIKQFWERILFKYYKWRGYEMIFLGTVFGRGDKIKMSYHRGFGNKCAAEGAMILAKRGSLVIINKKQTPNHYE